MNYECASKRYEAYFQKFLEKNIERSKMASMIYGVSGNRKRDNGYVKAKNSIFKPRHKETMIKPRDLNSHFTYGHTHNVYFAHKSWVGKTSRRTNQKGPKKLWVPKNKMVYVADILSSQVETSVMVPGL